MNTWTTVIRRTGFALALSSALLIGCKSAEPATPDSPLQVIERLAELEAAGKYGHVLRDVPPQDRELVVFITWFGAAYDAIGMAPEIQEKYRLMIVDLGLDEECLDRDGTGPGGMRRVAAESLQGMPLETIYKAVVAFSVAHGKFHEAFGFDKVVGVPTITGDKAMVPLGEREFNFVRIEGTWYWKPLLTQAG